MKIFAAILAFLLGAFSGFICSWRLKRRVKALSQCILLISEFATRIRYQSENISSIIGNAAGKSEYSLLDFLNEIGNSENFHNDWENSVNKCSYFTNEDKKLLNLLGSKLGATDKSGQEAHLSQCTELFKKQLTLAEEEYSRKGKMSRSIGVLGGLAAGIVML